MTDAMPQFTGITRYRDPLGRFSFRHPWDWAAARLDGDREGMLLTPDPADPDTCVAAWAATLPATVTPDDLPSLRNGLDTGLSTLPGLEVLAAEEETVGGAVRLERAVTFRAGEAGEDVVRQRRVWTLYAGRTQLVFIAQGSTRSAYAYWLPMTNYCWATLELGEDVWSGTDVDHAQGSGWGAADARDERAGVS
ncbi:hypothetical protein KEF29_17865 [Streptomyces tuirus]|uniref:DUF1795 domain-containing protein n=1 Tax=Streptomyces tuirus TaxID=68278 RepID=A0A941J005_9ACTN|nr:hypothetical protein [Streptomyces tuirus]